MRRACTSFLPGKTRRLATLGNRLACRVLFDRGYFSDHENSFPQEAAWISCVACQPGLATFGNCHSSGYRDPGNQLGEEHENRRRFSTPLQPRVPGLPATKSIFGSMNPTRLCEIRPSKSRDRRRLLGTRRSPVRLSATKPVTSSVPVTVTTAVEPPAIRDRAAENCRRFIAVSVAPADIHANGITKVESHRSGRAVLHHVRDESSW